MKLKLAIIIVLLFTCIVPAAGAAPANIVNVDGVKAGLRQAPILRDGVTLVQFAPIFKSLGLSVKWDPAKQQITGTKKGINLVLTVSNNNAYVNGSRMVLESPPVSLNGNIFVPLRFISEATGATLAVNGNTINITSYKGTEPFVPKPTPIPPVKTKAVKIEEELESKYSNLSFGKLHLNNLTYGVTDDSDTLTIAVEISDERTMQNIIDTFDSKPSTGHLLTKNIANHVHKKYGYKKVNIFIITFFIHSSYPSGYDAQYNIFVPEYNVYVTRWPLYGGSYNYSKKVANWYLDPTGDTEYMIYSSSL
ncbi:copper amine oxidase N-terminal domain-containing protein [Paenibacillus sp. MDMC362]|uniref:copper amine oxidase N-terminal domain-containing protein n=1 Tax=Paenibacillus sp. MDMC362 TaxID=2977365 RepID=UPI000DC5864E|nr:copper amine oxidase N-terminal domain-containing protein [Paenibacillus sp. MDMC362]RAR41641.1 copper amine oxidase N-terminal domain-containing protein [Paenibacillus sp. MDMC362]